MGKTGTDHWNEQKNCEIIWQSESEHTLTTKYKGKINKKLQKLYNF